MYDKIVLSVEQITEGESNLVPNLANTASILYHSLPNVNWAGFYLYDNTELVLGPFHGSPACIRIALGRGVCGTAAQKRTTIVVEDVHEFPGHIACDANSRSEVVVPLIHAGKLVGVLDVDSPLLGRFTQEDAEGLERVAALLMSRMPQ
ncbi:MAG: GAF domain-containing protein [Candidatus Kapabacteria bacterium]|nr:GAF domain-containing protein [Candidatus Kapabacteria bacterium]